MAADPGLQRGEWASNQNHFKPLSKTLHFYTGMIHPYPVKEESKRIIVNDESDLDYKEQE